MSTEIKPGQVWAWSPSIDADESQFRIMTVDANRVRYEYLRESDPHIEGGFTHAPATIREQCRLVTDVDTTPAPLDPSRIKAGDTVTVTVLADGMRREATVHGEAWAAEDGLRVGTVHLLADAVRLTDHQPAPDPEPVWEPGMLLLGNLAGSGMDDRFFFTDGNGGRVLVSDDGGTWDPGELLNAREAVVIDPAAVDVDALAAAIRKAEETGGPFTATTTRLALAALAHLGIEAS